MGSDRGNRRARSERQIKGFLEEMARQDNRGTSAPYFYVVRDVQWSYVGDEYEGIIEADIEVHSREDISCDDVDNGLTVVIDEGVEGGDDGETERRVYWLSWVEKGMFLLGKDCHRHLEKNGHHYSHLAHSYAKHAWRTHELRVFLEALYEHFEVDRGNLDF